MRRKAADRCRRAPGPVRFSVVTCLAYFLVVGCGGQASIGNGPASNASDDGGQAANAGAVGGSKNDASASSLTDAALDVTAATDAAAALDAGAAVDATACSRVTCPSGCCDANGQCQPGVAANACGTAGGVCQDCASIGASCDSARRACATSMTECGPVNCAGCCAGGACLSGTEPANCGSHGAQCSNCAATGAACLADAGAGCGPARPAKCDYYSCRNGCCDANGVCQSGASSSACGNGGGTCAVCRAGQGCSALQVCQCTPESCPSGCCDVVSGSCQPGTSDAFCGLGGHTCDTCSLTPQRGLITPTTCSNQECIMAPACTCPSGCCDANGICQPGSSNAQCGGPMAYCEDCTASGDQCSQQQCVANVDAGVCNLETCPSGCCDVSGQCQQGLTGGFCGAFGANCQNCLGSGQICSNQQCVYPAEGGVPCGPLTCEGCCDALGNCLMTNTDVECGNGGRLCADCTKVGGTCQPAFASVPPAPGACVVPDGGVICSQTCDGCCDANGNCQPGFADGQCGEVGRACQNCMALSPPSTCDQSVSPRTCTSQQMTCPAAYPSCPAGLQEPMLVPQKVCSTAELQSAAAACPDGLAATAACGTFTAYEFNTNFPCFNCLQNFIYTFAMQTGIRACAEPYVDVACNHQSACLADCVYQSCFECTDPDSTTQCGTQVQTGVCSAFFQPGSCIIPALGGAAAFCNPATYQNNFGAWLEAVGAKYCGQ